ncbi:MAG: TonB-dependent receptor plug domain-containing protein, partial [Bacteroidetes bacterium]|nr:TonB-dependent receptor plug domain-containing protein [Bacteroidota bacterium]
MSVLRIACLLTFGLIGLGLVAATPGQAQTALVRGFVTDAATGQPLQGATVALLRDTVLVTGTATDGDGLYVLPRLAPGTVRLRVSFVGYRPRTDTLRLRPDAVRTANVALAPAAAALEEVVVEEAGAPAQAGQRTLRPADLAALPAPDVTGDLANALTAQPGIVTTGDQGGRLYVRGGEPSQNLVLVDGMPVYQPVHLVGLYSALPADVVQRADVYAGGFGPEFGGRLSSVIDVTTRSGNLRRLAGAASLSPFVSGLRLEGPLAPGAASVLISARRSFVDEVAGPLAGTDLPYRFDDQFVKVSGLPSPNSRLSVQALRTYDRGTFGSADPDLLRADRITWTNYAAGARLLMLPAARPISAEVVASFSYLDMTVGPEATPLRASSIAQGQATADVTHYLGAFDLHWGLFVGTSAYAYELGGLFQIPDAERTFATEAGGYVAFAVRADRLELAPGLRIYALPNQRQVFAEPRGRVQFTAGRHRVH